jgi:hypothetical protein
MKRESQMDSRYLEAVVVGIITALVAGFLGIGAHTTAPTGHAGFDETQAIQPGYDAQPARKFVATQLGESDIP